MPVRHYASLWLPQQRALKEDLVTARSSTDTAALPRSLARAMARYETYYRARADAIREDPTLFLCAAWATPLERSMHWIAGWRPSVFIHLIYSESVLRFQAQLDDLIVGVHSGEDLGDLSPNQLARVDEVQRRAVAEEEKIADEMVEMQAGVADSFPSADADHLGSMERIIRKADDLRMRTLKDVVEFLEPLQVADLLVAAADLEIGIREVGMQQPKFGQ